MREEIAPSHDAKMHFEKGYLWEVALSQAFGEKAAVRPGEVERDGVIGSPDGLLCEDGDMVLEEYKATLMSSNKVPAENWAWMVQVKGYCYMLGVSRAIMRVLYLRGDYTSGVPEYAVWEFVFSERELAENWTAILNAKRDMESR
ncbi:MAG: hypothetical protein PHQ43_01125 [Dehalococcoidales bacterium]|nr:hypothetical protein [Dehalococcoidales bacterium]